MSRNIYRFPVERIKSPARKFDEPAIIYYLANERIERGLVRIEPRGRFPRDTGTTA